MFRIYAYLHTFCIPACFKTTFTFIFFSNLKKAAKAKVDHRLSVLEKTHQAASKHNSALEKSLQDILKRMENLYSENSALKTTLQNIEASTKQISTLETTHHGDLLKPMGNIERENSALLEATVQNIQTSTKKYQ